MDSTLPRIAADSGAPAFCTACMTAEPTPARSLGRSTRAVEAAVASASPKPSPVSAVQVAMNAFPLATVIVAPSTRPLVSSVNPSAAVSLVVSRAATLSARPAPRASSTPTPAVPRALFGSEAAAGGLIRSRAAKTRCTR